MTSIRCRPACRMSSANSLYCGCPTGPNVSLTIISENPITADSGVRSSWLMLVRKSVFARLAASASSRASRNAASRSFRNEMSLAISTVPPSFEGLWVSLHPTAVGEPHFPRRMRQAVVDFHGHPFPCGEGVAAARKELPDQRVGDQHAAVRTDQGDAASAPSIASASWVCAERRAAISRSIICRMLSRITVIEASNRPNSSLPPGPDVGIEFARRDAAGGMGGGGDRRDHLARQHQRDQTADQQHLDRGEHAQTVR